MNKHEFLFGYQINKLDLDKIVERSIQTIYRKDKALFACANAHSLMTSKYDIEFDLALNKTDFLVADGSGISLAGYILNTNFGPRITGYDYFIAMHEALRSGINGREARVYFMGSSQNTLNNIEKKFKKKYPEIELCGMYSPPYGEWPEGENEKIISNINRSNPDIVWVGMTAPKQEKWAFNNQNIINANIIGSVGAVFDFFAGTLNRAPKWMRNLGLEWLYRFIVEPKRTWRRHIISEPLFVLRVIKQRFRG